MRRERWSLRGRGKIENFYELFTFIFSLSNYSYVFNIVLNISHRLQKSGCKSSDRFKATELLLREEWRESVQVYSHFTDLCQDRISKLVSVTISNSEESGTEKTCFWEHKFTLKLFLFYIPVHVHSTTSLSIQPNMIFIFIFFCPGILTKRT